MKISIQDEVNTTLYLSKAYNNIDFTDKLDIEEYFRSLFKKLKVFYNCDTKGFYTIKVYSDKYYGSIIDMKKEELEYYDYYDNHIDMRFSVKNYSSFLYELDDFFNLDSKLIEKIIVYIYRDRMYARVIKNIDSVTLGRLVENSKIIYNEYINDIVDYGKIIEL